MTKITFNIQIVNQIDKNMIRLYPEVVPDKEINLKINSGLRSHDGLNLDKSYNY